MNIRLALLIPVMAAVAACSLVRPQVPAEPVTLPAPVSAVTLTSVPTPLGVTPVPQTGSRACVQDVTSRPLEAGSPEEYPRAILDYLNAAGSPIALTGLLNGLGVAAQPVAVAIGDFTGDGRDDVAVALAHPGDAGQPGTLLVYACAAPGYEMVHRQAAAEEHTNGFRIWFWHDLTADGRNELVIGREFCGAHTCFQDLAVLSWDGTSFVNVLEGSTDGLPFPAVRVVDPDGDRIYDLEVATGGFGSVGAGPQRSVTWIWTYNPPAGVWELSDQRAAPSVYRIHVLHDADDALRRANFDLAVQLYRRVIDDSTLDDWVVEEGAAQLAAYARYRLAVLAVALQDAAAAEAAFAELEAHYPVGDPRHDFVEMAILFRNSFASGGLGAACTGVAGFAEAHADIVLQPLGSLVYGYGNRDYTGESMCPAPEVAG